MLANALANALALLTNTTLLVFLLYTSNAVYVNNSILFKISSSTALRKCQEYVKLVCRLASGVIQSLSSFKGGEDFSPAELKEAAGTGSLILRSRL